MESNGKAKVATRDKETSLQSTKAQKKKKKKRVKACIHALLFSFMEGNAYSLLPTVAKNNLL